MVYVMAQLEDSLTNKRQSLVEPVASFFLVRLSGDCSNADAL